MLHMSLIVFIMIAGFSKADLANVTPFLPYSVRGIFNGASIVFFAYVGFDAVATTAEEVSGWVMAAEAAFDLTYGVCRHPLGMALGSRKWDNLQLILLLVLRNAEKGFGFGCRSSLMQGCLGVKRC
jgi:hypothetical protein